MKKIDITAEKWEVTKKKLKRKFALLSDSDLLPGLVKQEDILKRLQILLGKSKEEILTIISEL